MKKRNGWAWFLILIGVLVSFPLQAAATKGDSVGVKPIYPENQTGGETGYFNLKVTPGQEQDIELEITNNSSQEVTVDITNLQASTSDAGVITYSEDKKVDPSTPFPYKDVATLDKKELTIPALKSERVRVHLTIPKEAFQGKIIGGLTISEKRDLTKEEQKQSVVNEFQYAIPIILYESDEKVEPELTLDNVEPGLRNYRPYIEATLVNQAPINISTMEINGKIISKKDNKIVLERKELTYKMAPNSSFNYGFDLQNSKVKEGNYIAEFTIVADGKTFHLKKEFTISKAKAEEVNSQNLYAEEEEGLPWWWLALAIAGIVVVGGLGLIIYRKKRAAKQKKAGSKKRKPTPRTQGNKKSKPAIPTKPKTKSTKSKPVRKKTQTNEPQKSKKKPSKNQ